MKIMRFTVEIELEDEDELTDYEREVILLKMEDIVQSRGWNLHDSYTEEDEG